MKKFLLLFLLISIPVLAQQGPFAPVDTTWFNLNATTAFNPGPNSLHSLSSPVYGYGSIIITTSAIGGAPTNCSVSINFTGQSFSSQVPPFSPIFQATAAGPSFNPNSNTVIFQRLTGGSFAPYYQVSPSWSCATYPTSGNVTIEFIGDSWPVYLYSHINTNTNTVLKQNPAFLHTVVINAQGTSEVLTIFDNTACSGTVIAAITLAATDQFFLYDVQTNVGLCVTSSGTTAGDYTVSFR